MADVPSAAQFISSSLFSIPALEVQDEHQVSDYLLLQIIVNIPLLEACARSRMDGYLALKQQLPELERDSDPAPRYRSSASAGAKQPSLSHQIQPQAELAEKP
ncbi:unnamed protein product [Protopolystoma xenopodis]|uniref:Uncharacterized protein n=1 Tax=Protopolystoma xenopodis TaxID=117903 RepID=A0A3S5BPE2_9PLAT|nr:unnamed protein product [Protopolystoma xenopodis]